MGKGGEKMIQKFRLPGKGKWLIALAIAAVIAVPVSVFAATSDTAAAKSVRGFFGIDSSKLTDLQKQTVQEYSQKLADLQKQFIDDMVSNGSMTKEQGDAAKQRIDESLKNNEATGIIPGFGGGKKGFGGGKREGPGLFGADLSKLTDAQKKELTDSCKTIAGIQKDFLNKLAAAGVITSEKSDAAIKRLDEQIAALDKNGISEGAGVLMNGFGLMPFGIAGIDTSKLTEDQKSILTDYSTKLSEAQKEFIGKLVSDGVLTKEQGDAALQRMDNRKNAKAGTGFPMSGKMKGGRPGMHGKGGSSTSESAIQSSSGSL
jgi:polyhydroxyalkanoate synthesis regulator phasin